MYFKTGVKVENVKYHIIVAMSICERLFVSYSRTFIVTSVTDGVHKIGSKHYTGNAFDFRTWGFLTSSLNLFCQDLREKLGKDYDVVIESDHVHVEYDPR